jgi:hypothetical protein
VTTHGVIILDLIFNRVVRAKDSVSKAAVAVGLAKEVESHQRVEETKQGRFF